MDKITDIKEHADQAIEWIWAALPHLLWAILTLFIGIYVIKIINRLVRKFFAKKDYDLALETFLQSFINIGLKVILFVLVITQLGVQTSSLVAILASAGLAIGLALQGSLANFAGGVLILLFKPFKIGDWISAQGVSGSVKEISIFTTKLNTFENQIAIIPNGKLSNDNIVNYNGEGTRRENFVIGIGYNSNIKEAKEILLQICADNDKISKTPEPQVYVGNLGDSSVDISLRWWATNENFWPAHFYLREETKKRFDEAGIEIPFPQRVITQINA
jgi:small conductance mechanosensitive channel